MKVYQTKESAEKDLSKALADMKGDGEVYVERYTLGFVIAEQRLKNGVWTFQRYYKGE